MLDRLEEDDGVRDLVFGTTQGTAAAGVTLSPAADALPLRITLDVTGLGGRDAEILFRVVGFGSSSDASVTIDDVTVVGMSGFGASAPASELYAQFGITADAVATAAEQAIARRQTA